MSRAITSLALDVANARQRVRAGRGLDANGRKALADVLARTLMALAGRSVPARADTDPVAFIQVAVDLAREAGLAGPDLVAAFNDALERAPRRE